MNRRIATIIVISMLLLVTSVVVYNQYTKGQKYMGSDSGVIDKVSDYLSGDGGFTFGADTPGYENLKDLRQGCPIKDCIPSIDDPVYESVKDADKWLADESIVFVVEGESTRAYPQAILNWHEIVNENNFVVSFCPLCGSAIAFENSINGAKLEFGVSGKLHNSDLIMYDRQTKSLWQQITGEAIVGEMFGKKLKQIPMSGMRWKDFAKEFPEGRVLSRDTGASRDYDRYPYGQYEKSASVYFPVEGGVDKTIHPKEVVYGVNIDRVPKAYKEFDIKDKEEIKDTVGGREIVVAYNNGNVEVTESGKEISATRLFWFAWKAFNPDTKLYDGGD